MTNAFQCDYTLLTANDDGIRTEPPRVIYIHTFEGRDLDAVAMARYQLSPDAEGSYHIVIDVVGETARENDDEYIPWAAGWIANRNGHHVSLAGKAAFTREEWLSRTKQIDKLVDVIAAYCRTHGYPPIIRFAGDLVAGKWGISTHDAAAKAWGETDHHDPGAGFPLDVVAERVAAKLDAGRAPTPVPASPDPIPVAPGNKYPSYLDGRELRYSEFMRFVDEKVNRIFEHYFPDGADVFAVDIDDGKAGAAYPSYVDDSKAFTLDQYLRLIDYKIDHITRKVLP